MKSIPWLVIEPAKDDWVRWAISENKQAGEEKIRIYMPGETSFFGYPLAEFHLNPLECIGLPGHKPNWVSHLERTSEALAASLPMWESLPLLMEAAILHTGAKRYGEEFAIGSNGGVLPTLSDLKESIHYYLRQHQAGGYYDEAVKENIHASLDVRIDSLMRGNKGRVLNAGYSTPWAEMFDRPAVINLSKLGSLANRSLVMSFLLIALWEWRSFRFQTDSDYRSAALSNQLCHFTVVEEAHTVLRASKRTSSGDGSPQEAVAAMFEDMLAEIRQYGQGICLVNQGAVELIEGAVKNTGTKVCYRMQHARDREMICESIGLDKEQSRDLASLQPGHAVIATDIDPKSSYVDINWAVGETKT